MFVGMVRQDTIPRPSTDFFSRLIIIQQPLVQLDCLLAVFRDKHLLPDLEPIVEPVVGVGDYTAAHRRQFEGPGRRGFVHLPVRLPRNVEVDLRPTTELPEAVDRHPAAPLDRPEVDVPTPAADYEADITELPRRVRDHGRHEVLAVLRPNPKERDVMFVRDVDRGVQPGVRPVVDRMNFSRTEFLQPIDDPL